ncbi:MAG TPA: hypothetical protein VHB73_01490 [Alphaproteobacteria bacterium]|nr:hypothetical protein [Alphaproteobacteria bacterium]
MRDIVDSLSPIVSLPAASRTSGTGTGAFVDLLGYDSAMVEGVVGSYTSGTLAFSLQHSDDGTTGTAVDSTNGLQGSLPGGTAGTAVQKAGYVGGKRYLRALLVTDTGTAVAGANIIRGAASLKPAA